MTVDREREMGAAGKTQRPSDASDPNKDPSLQREAAGWPCEIQATGYISQATGYISEYLLHFFPYDTKTTNLRVKTVYSAMS